MKTNLLFKLISVSLTIIFSTTMPLLSSSAKVEIDQKPIPSYAKWGRFAMKETKAIYPHADIIDYLHIGRVTNPKTTTENFKLWLRDVETKKEFGVLITIQFDTNTEQLSSIHFQETTR